MKASPIFLILLILGVGVGLPLYVKLSEPDYYTQTVVVAVPGAYGTGWWLNDKGYIITAYHVVEDAHINNQPIIVIRGSWNATAIIYAFDPKLDIAVLKVQDPPSWAKGLPLYYRIYLGQRILVVGYPIQLYAETNKSYTLMSKSPRVAEGVISWIHPTEPLASFSVSTDAGNSGGPVLDEGSKAVVGIVVYARTGVVSADFYMLRADAIASFLDQHGIDYRVAGEGVKLAALGVAFLAVLGSLIVVFGARRG